MVFEFFRDFLTPEDPTSGFDLLFDLCTHIAKGRLSAPMAYLLGASHLLALEKPSRGVRPIAMEEILYRLVARSLGFQFWEALADHFSPLQFDVATRGGCIRQEDPLDGTLFALAHLRARGTVASEHPLCLFSSLVDDTHIRGPSEAIVPAFHTLEGHLTAVGLTVQPTKCAAWSPSGLLSSLSLPPSFTLPSVGLRVLGAPIGSDSFQASFVRDALKVDVSTIH
ncbi:hypothetical protein R1flu_006004 [Riccia fluitans]|uniref:Reverse transcriptase domain-containing protein n=1 Tax=Riccia fluitans TaxID=41844 RepID=A0ABD1YVL6_9MARC